MVKKLISRAEFARQAGVSGAAVTKACNNALSPACYGKRIDAAHTLAVDYIALKLRAQTPSAATGLDPLYEPVVEYCQVNNTWTKSAVQREFRISYARANSILQIMTANGLVNKDPVDVAIKPAAKITHVRGPVAAKETKKRLAYSEDSILEIPEDIQAFLHMTLHDLIERYGTDGRFVDWLSATQKIEAINEKRLKNATTEGELVSRKLVRTGIIEPIDACHIKLLTDGAKTIARRVTAMHSADRSIEDIEKFVMDQMSSFIRPVKAKVARAMRNA
jgi:hypothetical protein